MPTYSLNFVDADPWGILSRTNGGTATWSGPGTADGTAVITDNNTGTSGENLDFTGESSTADLTLGATSVTGVTVSALEGWTLRDTVTGDIFQVVTFYVPGGELGGLYYTLTEMPLVTGRSYETVTYTSTADDASGDPIFTYADYFANNTHVVTGTSGDDTINAGYTGDPEGHQIDDGLAGGAGGDDNLVYAEGGNDVVDAGDGADTVFGGTGNDTIDGGAGADSLLGEDGADSITGGTGNDTLEGGIGADTLVGGTGDDSLVGGDGADSIEGGANNDTIEGGDGADTLRGGAGDDNIDGGAGNDTIFFGAGNDTVFGGAGDDDIDDVAGGTETGANLIDAGAGNDTVFGGGGDDTIEGGDGDDVLNGEDDNDSITGGLGQDTISGGDGNDTIIGDGSDTREVLDWSAQGSDGTSVAGGFTQTTGEIDVSLTFSDDGNNNPTFQIETGDSVYVASGEEYDQNSSLFLFGNGDAATSTSTFDFAAATGANVEDYVENVAFRISDIDWASGNHQDVITITALDADLNPVTVTFTPAGNDTVVNNVITAGLTGETSADAAGSVLIEIAGPVSQISITYSNALSGTQGINVSDVHFDTVPTAATASDSLDGGAGDDSIEGMEGNDTIRGGAGDDTLSGGAGDDVFQLSDGELGNDVITDFDISDSDSNGFTNDQFDVSGLTDLDGNPVNAWDVVVADDGAGNALLTFPNGETLVLVGVDPASVTGAQALNSIGIPCFTAGTMIRTPKGEVPVETLKAGDKVFTKDNGIQELRWVGQRVLGPRDLLSQPEHKPILIPTGVMDNYAPLLVSPLHGMLAQRSDTGEEVFVRAKHLAEAAGPVRVAKGKKSVTYVHLMLDQHQVLFANGAASESFYPGEFALELYPLHEILKIRALVPGLGVQPVEDCYGPTARPFLKRKDALKSIDLRAPKKKFAIAAE